MSDPTWVSEDTPEPVRFGAGGMLRVLIRGGLFGSITFGGLAFLLVLRLIERPLNGAHRPWTPHITVFVCRSAFRFFGMGYGATGAPMAHPGTIVANHSSWMDIFALNAGGPLYFVSKSEVAKWPGIGWLARATGTVFVRRAARDARAQKTVFEDRLSAGHRLLFFPEGTSTDGQRVLAFKPTLFAALFSDHLPDDLWVQPVTVAYHAPKDQDPRYYGWWGDMEFGAHLVKVLASRPQGRVEVTWHAPLKVSDYADRKALARAAEDVVRSAHPGGEKTG